MNTPGFVLSDLFKLELPQKMRLRVDILELGCKCCDADKFLEELSSILIRYQLILPVQSLPVAPVVTDGELEKSEL